MNIDALIEALNADTKEERLAALREIKALTDKGELKTPEKTSYVNKPIRN